ncbi:DUF427 domain-containing protein [Rathayibacter tritici]|uniref:Uncharacterized protein n=1 Tax=Rathayibacter tritici TaxID=33888 RepID=A0A160KSL1_9MICO|nr:DUF427 domain-containing protein [Rathayibacter tritici]AND16374.1 hypothetical protein A6122_1228 [Rathayibacter tritici]PPF70296.1 DUF427 domain-containing protein [Rathayibacter tritici]PPG08578.1 DUF427 domain-containing protein [Rathayibacter tritici]PPI42645.1 DUF427 domain-containing protein [Rathayibacter tritici]
MKRVPPAEGQESVWDYPRPPRVEATSEHVVVTLGGVVVAETTDALRVLETSHPPVYYLPVSSFASGALEPAPGRSICEFKGAASYLTVRGGGGAIAEAAGWTYLEPMAGFEALVDTVALYPGRMDSCTVAGETVQPQPGDFYGGWITARVVGPFKGSPGTMFW